MRRFVLDRRYDVTGVSGTGTVAEGIEFTDGIVVMKWIVGDFRSMTVWNQGIEAVRQIHGHDGNTEVVWIDQPPSNIVSMTTSHWETGDRCKVIFRIEDQAPVVVGPGYIARIQDPGPIKTENTVKVIFDDKLVMGGSGTGWFPPTAVFPED